MRIQIDKFLRDYGLRTVGQLTRPKLHSVSKLNFPFNTNYHFMADNSAVIGPNQNDPIFKDMSGKLWIEHKLQITERLGNPRRTSVIAETLAAQFRRQNRFFKPLRKDEAVKLNMTNVAVFNYAMLDQLWKYQANYKSSFFRWSNNAATFWDGVKEADERFKRNQFIEIHLPDTIPTFSQFKQLTKNQTQELIGLFNSPALLNLFDLYRYVGSEPDTSNIAKLSKEQIQRVNFFIRVKGSFFVFNLGLLDSWINHPELLEETVALESMEPTEFYIDELGLEQYFVPNIMQRKLISLFTTLVEYNRGNEDLLETTQVLLEAEDPVIEDSTVDTEDVEEEDETDATVLAENTTITTFLDLDAIEVAYEPAPEADLEPITLVIERDISDSPPEAPTLKVDDKVTKAVDLTATDQVETKAVVGRAADLVRAGAISVRTYEQALLDSTSFERLPDPFGSDQTIAEAMAYTPDDTNVPEETIVGNTVVNDTTSVLKGMTKGYVSKLLKKDILQCIMAVQQQGVSVTNVTMETVEDALNHYMIFTVTLKPIRGKSSQVTFRVPVVDENGRFRANNVDYRQRYQRSD